LVDYDANGSMTGDVMVIKKREKYAMVNDIDGYTNQNLPICAAIAQIHPNICPTIPIILIMHQYDYLGKGKTIHSSGQIEFYKNAVIDKPSEDEGNV